MKETNFKINFYQPSDDSFLLAETAKKYFKKNLKVLDMGCGSAIQSKNAIQSGVSKSNILAVDINEDALKQAKLLGIKTLKSNLFEKLEGKIVSGKPLVVPQFDLILFNPPYLPESEFDKEIDTTGGKKGDEIIIKFIQQLPKHLTKKGISLLLTSSHTIEKNWQKTAKENSLKFKKIATKNLFFEKLFVWEISSQ